MQTEPPFRVPGSLPDAIAEYLGGAIADGRLRPGQRLVESQLCEELSVSRTPLREALRRLSAEGLVELSTRRGARVAELTEKSISDGFMVRAVLEGLAARLASVAPTKGQIATLEKLNTDMEMVVAARDAKGFFELNTQFHELIATASDNPYLASLQRNASMRSYRPLLLSLASSDHLRASITDHRSILDAIRSSDAAAAERNMVKHISNAATEAIRVTRRFWIEGGEGRPPSDPVNAHAEMD